ncbi:class I SAM-dependent DNA methyltransferase [Streptomyces montanisoli]|uniref:Methyltransferase domain-containing protein n=1 Tax=Streptomyces montanisoli TaxID=2798581 RepID=A0A940MF78_9ACTN|nr:SAM-dependent methyltransferase [Streptomyces montanisoli]MBP0461865.1 methyltransferase domain-containing protein [Streptomyces montanisoli]
MSTPPGYFDTMYASSADPWDLAGRWYERRKYALTVAALPRPHYRSAFEPGCSVGVLTERLARRCDRLLAVDRVESAVRTAAERVRGLDHVEVATMAVPGQWPGGSFDLIVLSELLYYFDDDTRGRLLDRALESLEPGGTLVAVHWDHPVPEHHRTGSELAAPLASVPGLSPLTDVRDSDFRLQVFTRTDPADGTPLSPAAEEGLL